MSLPLAPPSPEERARLKLEAAHRFPELATLPLLGDGGAPVSLPVVLGNPSGTCILPAGDKASPVWANVVRQSLGLGAAPGDVALALAGDCVLYPPAPAWAECVARWPGLPVAVSDQVQTKIGLRQGVLGEPWSGDPVPSPIAAKLEADPRAIWVHARPRDSVHFALALSPPDGALWRAVNVALRHPQADHWRQARGLVERRTLAAVVEDRDSGAWQEIPIAEVVGRFPGLGVFLFGKLGELVGAGAKAELGEL